MLPSQLIAWRTAGAMSRETAAKLLGCSAKSLGRYESGERSIPDAIAAATLTMGKPAEAGVEIAPRHDRANYLTWDNPKNAPRLWSPGKKHGSWDRLPAGAPLHPVGITWFNEMEIERKALDAERETLLATHFTPPVATPADDYVHEPDGD